MLFNIEKITQNFPFVSKLVSDDNSIYCGIIINCDKNGISFINLDYIYDQKDFLRLMKVAQRWWWYSNRMIPLNLFYYDEILPYMVFVTHLPTKTTNISEGHIASLQKILETSKISKKNRTLNVINKI